MMKGYIKSETYFDEDSFQDYTDYCKYYYTDEADEKFANSSVYEKVGDNISKVKEYFKDFKEVMESQERTDEYDFNTKCITSNDYVYIITKEGQKIGDSVYGKYDNYTVYFYDVEEKIMYYLHDNI